MSTPARDAGLILRAGFVVLPVAAGADKFAGILTDWEKYIAPWVADLLPVSTAAFMAVVGLVEIAAGLTVALRPRFGAWLVAAWLGVIVLNLIGLPQYWDVAARDVGLLLAAIALARLSGEEAESP